MNRFLKPSQGQVDPSQFAVLRLLLLLLSHRKGGLSRMEANWFVHETRKHNLSKEQRDILHADLEKHPLIDAIFEQVQDQDLEPMFRLLGLGTKIDGKVTGEEKAFLTELQNLTKLRQLNPKEVINAFVADHVHRQEVWRELKALGEALSKPAPRYRRFF